jgi:5-formyltetrahydrofolate cyclo-ligase
MCSPTSKKLCGECSTCYNRSFATHPRAVYWSSKNELEPKQVLKNSNKKYLFDCPDCEHELEMMVKNVNIGQWCKYCNSDGLCDKDCEFCYKKSFASHPMAIYWSSKNEINPRNILKRSDKKAWFDCNKCKHEFECRLFSITTDEHCIYCSNQKLCKNCEYCFKKSCASHEMN